MSEHVFGFLSVVAAQHRRVRKIRQCFHRLFVEAAHRTLSNHHRVDVIAAADRAKVRLTEFVSACVGGGGHGVCALVAGVCDGDRPDSVVDVSVQLSGVAAVCDIARAVPVARNSREPVFVAPRLDEAVRLPAIPVLPRVPEHMHIPSVAFVVDHAASQGVFSVLVQGARRPQCVRIATALIRAVVVVMVADGHAERHGNARGCDGVVLNQRTV